ncbi:MAG: spermidine synthase, partial [Limisphaerales bacterium]
VRRGAEWSPAAHRGGTAVLCGISGGMLGWSGTALNAMRGLGWAWAGELVVAVVVFVPPSAGMGMLFSHWVQRASAAGRGGVGSAVAWNCLGAAMAGPVLAGGVLPVLGLKASLLLTSAGYLLLAPWRSWGSRRASGWMLPALFGGVAAGVAWGVQFLHLPPGSSVIRSWDGRMASVAVIRTSDGERVLRVNNHFQQGGTATALAARRHAHIPLLLHPGPSTVLFLGIGTGITLGASADHPGLRAEGVELLPEVVRALPEFEPENRSPQKRPGFEVVTADARRHVRTARARFDVIVADLFHPAEDGAGMLYTREHFRAIRERLNPGGVFCQWLPLHQLDREGFDDVGATFLEVFPEASLWLLRFNVDVPVVGLIGVEGPWLARPEDMDRRQGTGELAVALKAVGLGDPVRLLGCRIADSSSLRRLTRGGRVATDDLPRVLYGAARAAYREAGPPHRRLLDLLGGADPGFEHCLAPADQEPWLKRLRDFRSARDLHLAGLGKESEGRAREALDDYVASAGFSADYTAGYAQAVLVASAYAREDPEWARTVLNRLVAVRPEQGLARELLGRLAP